MQKEIEEIKVAFGATLDHERQKCGLTFLDIESATGIPKSTLHGWTLGIKAVGHESVLTLSEFFGVTVYYMLTGKASRDSKRAAELEKKVQALELEKDMKILELEESQNQLSMLGIMGEETNKVRAESQVIRRTGKIKKLDQEENSINENVA